MFELRLEGFEEIRKSDIDRNYRWILIPNSVTKIEKGAFERIEQYPDTFTYDGTLEELNNIEGIEESGALCVNCVDGLQILHI